MNRQDKKGPVYITPGTVAVKVYQGLSHGYDLFTVAWQGPEKRERRTFSKLAVARREAQLIAAKIATGQQSVMQLTAAQRDSYVAAVRDLPEGVPLHDAVRQFAAAVRVLPESTTLLAAAEAFAKRAGAVAGKRPVAELVGTFLAGRTRDREKGHLSQRQLQTLRSHLNRFAGRFKTDIGQVQPRDIEAWLRDTAEAPKSWNNLRTSTLTFFRWVREQGILPADLPTAPEKVKRRKVGDADVGILTPAELQKLLASADAEASLYLAIGAFTGIRTAELQRLEWDHIDTAMGIIRLDKSITKTAHKRNVPILPSLAAWLYPYAGATGKVFSSIKATDRTIAFVKAQGIEWPANALRHSFGSYRTAEVKSHPQVALEMGNSVAMVRRHYDRVVSEEEAKDWFAVSEAPVVGLSINRI